MNCLIDYSAEVKQALDQGLPVVALESTIISHGMPYPRNVETALLVQKTVRETGAIPATIAIIGGRLKVGLSEEQIDYFGKRGTSIIKASRRDIPALVASGQDGATTVAATMIIAHLAGIKVFATGGIGGVHKGAQQTMDISADLEELAKTPVLVVCAGPKAILDLSLTMEYLETKGVNVVGYQTDELPAFYTRQSGIKVNYNAQSASEIASIFNAQKVLGYNSGMLITNPIPQQYSMDPTYINAEIEIALEEMNAAGIKGKDTTPYLLDRISALSFGQSLEANIQLVLNNARLAGEIARGLVN